MVEAPIFIGFAIAGITQFIKLVAPRVSGAMTIVVAAVVGAVIAMIDVQIGVVDISIAQGIMLGLAAAGVVATASR